MSHVANPPRHVGLEARKRDLEEELRSRFAGQDRASLKAIPVVRAYTDYYKRFGKSYHVMLQLESVALKGKPLPDVAALVECMFMAELKNQVLTAGHDLDVVQMPVGVDVARGTECYTRIDRQDQNLKPADMMISDAGGVISSIVYGPDHRTRIRPDTRRVLFTGYAPPGVDARAVHSHLDDLRANVLIVSPEAEVSFLEVFRASDLHP